MCGYGLHHRRHRNCCRGETRYWSWGPGFHRRFSTREGRIARLEEYLKELQAEAQAVQEYLAEAKGGH